MAYPTHRMRRLRKTKALRDLFQETQLNPSHFILPLFVDEAIQSPVEIASMPGVKRHSYSSLIRTARSAHSLGLPAVLLFGIPKKKDP
ncbi:MAG TPA: porphobilinogen synthase, partial [bacterium]